MELLFKFANLNKAIIDSLNDEYNIVRRRAINSLEKIGYKDNIITYSLIKSLEDDDLFVKQNALLALGKIGNNNSIEHSMRPALMKIHVFKRLQNKLGVV